MTISKKIILSILGSIFFITIINIASFYFFYSYYFKIYLSEKIQTKKEITIDYVNQIIEKQALDEVDSIFNDIELSFFELLDKNKGKIKLDTKENIDIVVNYLSKAGVNLKYIEDVIPKNYLEEIIKNIKNKQTPEYNFFNRLINSVLITNLISILILILFILIFTRKIFLPVREITSKIKNLKIGKDFRMISYKKEDEIGLLVNAINGLNLKLNIGENIRNKLLADISHELKTPITAIQCYVEGIKDGVIKLDERTLNSIINEMQRLIKLVNKIMEFEKFENKEIVLDLKQEDIRCITQEVIKQFRQKLKISNQKIITSGLDKKILTDKDSFIQIVQNIISNFIKYAGNGKTLKIEFGVNFIKFSDNGKGISKSELPYIKEKFYQGKQEKTGDIDDRGIGIGFSVIDKIVKALNWEMEIISEEGKGLEIKIITKNSN
ncbi:MAG: HAMP domain-containing sensor histidine kinase [Candidatus Gracilibacteria bacterium]|nr:HAMP domain-containing sensor histidine kinase [Candidatus Gracilibacteria bacterium]